MSELRLTKRGDKWQYSFEIPSQNGKRKRITKSGFKTKGDANKEGTKAKALYDNGGVIVRNKKASMNDMFDLFLEDIEGTLKPSTHATYKVRIDVHLRKLFGDYDFNQLNRAMIQNTIDKYDTSKYTMNSMVTAMQSFYKWSVKRGYTEHNPMREIIKPRIDTNEPKRYLISKETFMKIVTAYSEFRVPLYIMYYTGMRKGEALALQWDDIDLDNDIIHVKHNMTYVDGYNVLGTPKTNLSRRDVFIGKTLKLVLQEELATKKGYVGYKLDGNKVIKSYDDNQLHFVCTFASGELIDKNKLANLSYNISTKITKEFNYHSLRHTHISNLLMNGADIKAVQQRVGHSDVSTTLNIYAKVNETRMRETANLTEL